MLASFPAKTVNHNSPPLENPTTNSAYSGPALDATVPGALNMEPSLSNRPLVGGTSGQGPQSSMHGIGPCRRIPDLPVPARSTHAARLNRTVDPPSALRVAPEGAAVTFAALIDVGRMRRRRRGGIWILPASHAVARAHAEGDVSGVRRAQGGAPWARAGSGFTLLFEAYVLALAKSMPIANAAERLGEHDTRLWRIVEHYVWRAVEKLDLSLVRRIAADETSARRGHDTSACSLTWRGARSSTSPTARTRRP